MNIQVNSYQHWMVVSVNGRVDAFNYLHVTREIYNLVSKDHSHIALDLTQADFLSLPTIKFVANTAELLRVRGGEFAIIGPDETILKHLQIFSDVKRLKIYSRFSEMANSEEDNAVLPPKSINIEN